MEFDLWKTFQFRWRIWYLHSATKSTQKPEMLYRVFVEIDLCTLCAINQEQQNNKTPIRVELRHVINKLSFVCRVLECEVGRNRSYVNTNSVNVTKYSISTKGLLTVCDPKMKHRLTGRKCLKTLMIGCIVN